MKRMIMNLIKVYIAGWVIGKVTQAFGVSKSRSKSSM
jgi:hypothetical protein